jgi:hypothetical protein
MRVAQLLQRLSAGSSFTDRIHGTVLLQVVPQTGADHRVIVCNEHIRHLYLQARRSAPLTTGTTVPGATPTESTPFC